jgi:hypothetical protein
MQSLQSEGFFYILIKPFEKSKVKITNGVQRGHST